MEFKNIKRLKYEELSEYLKEIESEYEKNKKKLEKLCEIISELNDEYIATSDEIDNRKKLLGDGGNSDS